MTSKMDEIFRKVLNDREIFDTPYEDGKPVPELFKGENWKELKKLFSESKNEDFRDKIQYRLNEIDEQEKYASERRRKKIDELKNRAKWLETAIENKKNLLTNLFNNLEWYGLVECKLPSMDNYGVVIERYNLSIVEQYFIDKTKKDSKESRALRRVLEYVKELYEAGVPPEEIAYFVRKMNSLTSYWEVIK